MNTVRHNTTAPAAETVSVVMPAHNCGSSIQAAFDSAINQQEVDTTVIIVDDGSTDDTLSYIQNLKKQHPGKVEILTQKNGGPAAARNTAIAAATGDWIAFLDHDDIWQPDKLKQQLALAESTQADVVITGTRNLGGADRVAEFREMPNLDESSDVFQLLLNENFVTLSSAVVRRSKLSEVGGFNAEWRGVEDWGLWLQLAGLGCKFSAVSSPLVDYHWSDNSLSRQHEPMQRQRQALVQQTLQTPAGRAISFVNRRKIIANERNCSAWAMTSTSFSRAAWFYTEALMAWPFGVESALGLVKCALRRS